MQNMRERSLAGPNGARLETGFDASLVALRPRLQRYARSLAKDVDVAEDLVQDTMLRAWGARAQFAPGTSLIAWLSTILRNLFLNARRRDRFHGDYDELAAERILASTGDQDAAIDLSDVTKAMAALPSDQQRALELVAIAGFSAEEAAARIGTPAGTMKSRVSRGRAALTQILSEAGPGPKTSRPPAANSDCDKPRRGEWRRMKRAGQPLWIG